MSIYDIIVSMCHDIIHDLNDIMSSDTDIVCYIIGYIPVRPEIWSGQVLAALLGTCPIASQCRTLSSAARYGPGRCLPFLSQLRVGGPHLPGAACGRGQVRPAVSFAK